MGANFTSYGRSANESLILLPRSGAGDGVELAEIQKLNQCIKQDTVNLDTVRYTANAKSRSVRFHET
jgi:hypothetical protein